MKKENGGGYYELGGMPVVGWVAAWLDLQDCWAQLSLCPAVVPTQATRNTQKQINTSELSYLRF